MRFGSCGNLTSSRPDKTGIETIERLKECGYDYIELPIGEIMDLSDAERQAIVDRVNRSGLKSEVINNLFPRRLKLTGPCVNREEIRRYYETAIPLCKKLGAENIVFGSPFAKSYPLGFSKEIAMEQLTDLTAELDEYAGEVGVQMIIEPIHSFECNIINSFGEGVALANAVNAKHTYVLLDYYHMTRDKGSLEELEKYGKKYLKHVHFACPFLPGEGERVFPLYADEWNYSPFIATLKAIGYEGRVSIEARTSDFYNHAKRSIDILKLLFN